MVGSHREVGRRWEGNTQIIYYELTDTHEIGCGDTCIGKIVNFTYKSLIMFGIVVYFLILIAFNDILTKILVVIEGCFNIYTFVIIKITQKFLKINNNNTNSNSESLC